MKLWISGEAHMEMSVVQICDDENTTHLRRQHNIPRISKKVFVQVVSSLHQSHIISIKKNLETIFWRCHNLDISVDFFFAYLGTTYLPAKLI